MDLDLSYGVSLAFVLTAAFAWNTWTIALKYIDRDYPLDAFSLVLYAASCALMWGTGIVLEGPRLTAQMSRAAAQSPHLVPLILGVGALFGLGVRVGLGLYASVGLLLTAAVRSSIVVLLGTVVSISVGGVPEGTSAAPILIAAGLLLLAVLVGLRAGQERDPRDSPAGSPSVRANWSVVGRALVSAVLILAYSYGLSIGIRSTSHPQGMDAVAYMALLSTGSFLGAVAWSGTRLTYRREWDIVRRAHPRHLWLAIGCAVAHYGGNLIHALGVPTLSTAIAWPLGTAGDLWTYLWGLVYGEFRGASRKAWCLLWLTLALFVAGSVLLAATRYW